MISLRNTKALRRFAGILLAAAAVTSGPARCAAECAKSVSFAVTNGGQPVESIPKFVAHWMSEGKRQQQFANLCFGQSPDPRAKSYIVIFSAKPENLDGLTPSVLKYINSTSVSEDATVRQIYGQLWHYDVDHPPAGDSSSFNLLKIEGASTLVARAYNDQGAVVSQVNLKDISGWLHTRDKMLEKLLGDISADSRVSDGSPTAVKTSLPVYYVNCDVPLKSLAGELASDPDPKSSRPAPTQPPAPPKPPLVTLELSSTPAGADVYVDGEFVGKTPTSLSASPGEHTVVMRKANYSTWQRQVQATGAKRRVAGYLEQRVVVFGAGQP